MYVGMTMFNMPPGMRPEMEQLADKMLPMMGQMSGFVSVNFVVNEKTNEYGGITLWETKENALAGMRMTGPKLKEALAGKVIGSTRQTVYEVYESQV